MLQMEHVGDTVTWYANGVQFSTPLDISSYTFARGGRIFVGGINTTVDNFSVSAGACPESVQSVMGEPAFDQSVVANSYVTGGAGSTINGEILTRLYLTTGASATINGDSVAVAATTLGASAIVSGSQIQNLPAPAVTAAQQDILAA